MNHNIFDDFRNDEIPPGYLENLEEIPAGPFDDLKLRAIPNPESTLSVGDYIEGMKVIGAMAGNTANKPTPSVLDDAKKTINIDRQDNYGDPEDSFPIIATYWDTYVIERVRKVCRAAMGDEHYYAVSTILAANEVIRPVDSVNMLVLFKEARKLGQKENRDNYVDSIGYNAIAADRLIKWEAEK